MGEHHRVVFFDNIKSTGSIEYKFIVGLFDDRTQKASIFITSEVNTMAKRFGGPSHFLCVFDNNMHSNLGASDDWGHRGKFFSKALEIAAKQVGITPRESSE